VRIQVFKAGLLKKKWAFHFLGANGEILVWSETYSRRIDAETTARLVADGFKDAPIEVVE
jgi:uncharacterized protein YegP (UPF0339 family)